MSDRFDQLEMRRRQLLLRSDRLRAEFAADQRILHEALGNVDRAVGTARRYAPTALIAGGGLLLLTMLRRRRLPVRSAGFVMRTLAWVTLARRALTILALVRAVTRARRAQAEPQP